MARVTEDFEPAEQSKKLAYSDLSGAPLQLSPESVVYGEDKAEAAHKSSPKLHRCVACQKQFSTTFSLQRHKERFPVCANWKEDSNTAALINAPSAYTWAMGIIDKALQHDADHKTKCIFCYREFSSVGNFHKHFENSVACNAKAYDRIKKAFAAQTI